MADRLSTVYAAVLTDWFGLSLNDTRIVLQDTSLEPFSGLFKPQAGVTKSGTIPFGLSVYPNPLLANGTVTFDLPQNSYVKIDMISADGRVVQSITERAFAAGSYTLPLSVDVPSGAYLLSMRAGDARLTRIVSVVR